MLNKDLLK
ncbi:hypothetical protein SCAR479_13857 [Seiridium cardinale]|uniref:Uncharacterized protein n=1 Tax=Seiridium cardinale TaxID=138064 RepID=A0ABR2X6Q1_9PEZI